MNRIRPFRRLTPSLAAILGLAAGAFSCAAGADTLSDDGVKGFKAFEAGDYATALKEFMPLAEKGQPSAEAAVGQMYLQGLGVKQDYGQAAAWLQKAAAGGIAQAQAQLGTLYLVGEGVAADPALAAKWTTAAANQGLARAQLDLATMYYQGVGVPKDQVQAYLYATLAARQGNEDAKNIVELLSEDLKPEDLAKGDALVKAWKPLLPEVQ